MKREKTLLMIATILILITCIILILLIIFEWGFFIHGLVSSFNSIHYVIISLTCLSGCIEKTQSSRFSSYRKD